jgi:hypothetical protein
MYTVRWKRTALDKLTELWLDATDRTAINNAVEEIDRLLASNPHEARLCRVKVARLACPPSSDLSRPPHMFESYQDGLGSAPKTLRGS